MQVTVTDGEGGNDSLSTVLNVENLAPLLNDLQTPTNGFVGFASRMSATASDTADDSETLDYRWLVTGPQGQTTLHGTTPSFVPTSAGRYTIALTVTDRDNGQVASNIRTLDVASTPVVISSIVVPNSGPEGSQVRFSAQGSDTLDASMVSFEWQITRPDNTVVSLQARRSNSCRRIREAIPSR